jgi:hypothetical protein
MAKGKSKKSGKARDTKSRAAANDPRMKSIPRGVRKHLRQLERQLSDAARQERKRLRKLERTIFRRQMLQAALEELRGETMVVVVPTTEMVRPAQEVPVTSAEVTSPPAKPRPATVRTRTRPATAAVKRATKPTTDTPGSQK